MLSSASYVAMWKCQQLVYHLSQYYIQLLCLQVEDSWKLAEFIVIPHRDSKDVFILGGTDDIQVLLDDSQVNISTIAGSRHVGPIKPKVEEWSKQLSLFSETLVLFLAFVVNLYNAIFYRMNGQNAREIGCILKVYLVLLISRDSYQMKLKCLYRWISLGRI